MKIVRTSCPIIMWNWPDIFKIWSDNVRWPTVISSPAVVSKNVQTIGTIIWKCYPDDRKRPGRSKIYTIAPIIRIELNSIQAIEVVSVVPVVCDRLGSVSIWSSRSSEHFFWDNWDDSDDPDDHMETRLKKRQVVLSPRVAGFQRYDCTLQKKSGLCHYVTSV